MSPDLHHLSGAYAVDALDGDERDAFERHLATCADCRAEVAELSATAQSLAATTEVTPPPALRASVLAGISGVRPLPPLTATVDDGPHEAPSSTPVGARPPAHRAESGNGVVRLLRRPTTWLAVAAAAVLVAVLGTVWGPSADEPQRLTAVQQVQQAADAREATATAGDVRTTVAWSPELGRSAISVSGLPPAPEGRTYQLWYIGTDNVVRSAGLFTTRADGTGEALLQGDANTAATVAISVEPTGGSPAPTTTPLVAVDLQA